MKTKPTSAKPYQIFVPKPWRLPTKPCVIITSRKAEDSRIPTAIAEIFVLTTNEHNPFRSVAIRCPLKDVEVIEATMSEHELPYMELTARDWAIARLDEDIATWFEQHPGTPYPERPDLIANSKFLARASLLGTYAKELLNRVEAATKCPELMEHVHVILALLPGITIKEI